MENETFGSRLKSLRKERHLTLDQVGQAIGMTRHSVGNLEHNRAAPSVETLKKIAQHLGCDANYLLGIIDTPVIYGTEIISVPPPDELTFEFERDGKKLTLRFQSGTPDSVIADKIKMCLELTFGRTDERGPG